MTQQEKQAVLQNILSSFIDSGEFDEIDFVEALGIHLAKDSSYRGQMSDIQEHLNDVTSLLNEAPKPTAYQRA